MSNGFLQQKVGYRDLIAYKVAECIYDITYFFTSKFLQKGDRTIDQMVQAARSGKQNIAEGNAAAVTSRETELKLTNVAKASLQELLIDYEDYLRTRGLTKWDAGSEKFQTTRRVCAAHCYTQYYQERLPERSDETIANIALILINQCDYLLFRLIEAQKQKFLQEGGIKEEMYRARVSHRDGQKR